MSAQLVHTTVLRDVLTLLDPIPVPVTPDTDWIAMEGHAPFQVIRGISCNLLECFRRTTTTQRNPSVIINPHCVRAACAVNTARMRPKEPKQTVAHSTQYHMITVIMYTCIYIEHLPGMQGVTGTGCVVKYL